ncbi:MAG: cell division protein FtsZ [Chitinophagales bacterium]
MGILTIGIVTVPFGFEGKRRKTHATEGLETLKHYVDAILVVSNDKLRDMFGNLAWNEAFAKADDVLTTAAKGIAEIITVPGYVNVDFEDVKTVLRDSGMAIMGSGTAMGENRAIDAVKMALESPLLNDNDIRGARNILLNITSGSSAVLMDEIAEITDFVQEAAGHECDIIWGNCTDESVGEGLTVTVIATGFETMEQRNSRIKQSTYRIMHLDTNDKTEESAEVETMEQVVEEKVMQIERTEEREETFEEEDQGITIKVNGETKYEEKKQKKEEDKANPRQFTFDFGMFEQHAEEEEEESVAEITETPVMESPITEIISEQEEEKIEELIEEKEEIIFEEEKQEPVFEIRKEVRQPEYPEMKKEEKEEKKEEAPQIQKKVLSGNDDKMHIVQHQNSDRINRLRSMSTKLNSNYDEMEKVPAYLRRNVELEETPDAREINVSKYQVEDGDNGPEIKKNNSFLHDNVD